MSDKMGPCLAPPLAIVACNIIFTLLCLNFVSAARIYDQGTLLHIKDSMDSYRKTFPPPFICSSPECTLLYIPVGFNPKNEGGEPGLVSR